MDQLPPRRGTNELYDARDRGRINYVELAFINGPSGIKMTHGQREKSEGQKSGNWKGRMKRNAKVRTMGE